MVLTFMGPIQPKTRISNFYDVQVRSIINFLVETFWHILESKGT